MRVASWNVNSIRARLSRVLSFLQRQDPDVLCLQETKATDSDFPTIEIEAAGYRTILHGQQNYNGVAILVKGFSRQSNLASFATDSAPRDTATTDLGAPKEVKRGFPENPVPEEARALSACVGEIRVLNVYVINGRAMESDSFETKQQWMAAIGEWIRDLPSDPPLLMVGDFNVAPDHRDVWDPEGLEDRIHCTDEERAWLSDLKGDCLQDLLREHKAEERIYTWWPYQDNAFERNEGLRFDLALGDESLVDSVVDVWVDTEERRPEPRKEKPSDHAPLIVDLDS